MLKINIFLAVFKKPLRMHHCFLCGPYFMPIFNGQFLKCDIFPVSNDPVLVMGRLNTCPFLTSFLCIISLLILFWSDDNTPDANSCPGVVLVSSSSVNLKTQTQTLIVLIFSFSGV